MNAVSSSLKDFGDWISPIIVKELRQGMRTKVFTAAFIVLQGFMVLFILVGWNQDRTSHSEDASGFFWGCVFITLILVLPLRGFGALSSEVKLDTMDLISLTRLSAWRITAGKWFALVSQSILVAIAVMPYVVLRYFFGGVNLFAELLFLGMALVMSCLLTAIMVGLSAFSNFLIRGILVVAAAAVSLTLIVEFISTSSRMPNGIPFSDIAGYGYLYLGIILGSLFLMYYFLDMGATRMAPEAINHSTRKRLISILFLAALLAMPILFDSLEAEAFYFLGSALIGLFALDALTERPSGVRSLHRPFARGGPVGWLFQLFFSPGWFSGLFYVFVLGGMLFGAELILDIYGRTLVANLTLHLSFVGMLVFPVLVIHLFYPDLKSFFSAYFFIQCAAVAIGTCLSIIDGTVAIRAIMWAGCPLPFVSYLMAWQDNYDSNGPALLALSSITLFITTLVCLIRGSTQIRLWKKFRKEIHDSQNPS
ncbi:MAG: hypothetical protein ACI8UO_000121 [Verrucomicrobiales bacterium]